MRRRVSADNQESAQPHRRTHRSRLQWLRGGRADPEHPASPRWRTAGKLAASARRSAAGQSLEKIISFSPKVDNTIRNFLPANHLVSAWAIEKTTNGTQAEEWLRKQAALYPANKIVQWTLHHYSKNEPVILSEDEKDGEVRILEFLGND